MIPSTALYVLPHFATGFFVSPSLCRISDRRIIGRTIQAFVVSPLARCQGTGTVVTLEALGRACYSGYRFGGLSSYENGWVNARNRYGVALSVATSLFCSPVLMGSGQVASQNGRSAWCSWGSDGSRVSRKTAIYAPKNEGPMLGAHQYAFGS